MRQVDLFMERHAYPLAIIQDLYSGCYARGDWIAIACADEPELGGRIVENLSPDEGIESPWSDDVSAMSFWKAPPDCVAVGATPDEAAAALLRKGWWIDHKQATREIDAMLPNAGAFGFCPAEVAKRLNPEKWELLLGQVLASVGQYGPNETECITPDGIVITNFWQADSIGATSDGVELHIEGTRLIVRIRRRTSPRV